MVMSKCSIIAFCWFELKLLRFDPVPAVVSTLAKFVVCPLPLPFPLPTTDPVPKFSGVDPENDLECDFEWFCPPPGFELCLPGELNIKGLPVDLFFGDAIS